MQSIETVYNGMKLRSRFEADVALLLDTMGLEWKYEPTSFLLEDGTHYMPDFWLRECRLWVEVRGYESEKGERQIRGFAEHLARQAPPSKKRPDYMVVRPTGASFFDGWWGQWGAEPVLLSCGDCGRPSFMDMFTAWGCRLCRGINNKPWRYGSIWALEMVEGRIGARTDRDLLLTLPELVQVLRADPVPTQRIVKFKPVVTVGDVLASLQGSNTGTGRALRRADLNERIRTLDSAEGAA